MARGIRTGEFFGAYAMRFKRASFGAAMLDNLAREQRWACTVCFYAGERLRVFLTARAMRLLSNALPLLWDAQPCTTSRAQCVSYSSMQHAMWRDAQR
jgi:hypothetical protein